MFIAMKMKYTLTIVFAGLLLGSDSPAGANEFTALAVGPPGNDLLRGADARKQLVVTGETADGWALDISSSVSYECVPEGVVKIDSRGFVTPVANGEVVVRVAAAGQGGKPVIGEKKLKVENYVDQPVVNFPNQVVPIFTKHGCNGGGCHGKSGGQNGFRLSLLGFYPTEDHEYLVKEGRGRRITPAAPGLSLLLRKALNVSPHGGGKRFGEESYEYRIIHRWMRQGMPYGNAADLRVERVEVFPPQRKMSKGSMQQLSVIAFYNDGSYEDVTPMATFEVNDKEMGEVDLKGRVQVYDLSGDVAVMVRYQGQVGVFRSTVPLGVEVTNLPEPRNFIDTAVFNKLKLLGMPPSEACDDQTFIRRVTIDIAGRLPTAEEAEAFAADDTETRRDMAIERLLESGGYADYFTNKWAALLRNKKTKASYELGTFSFHDWLREMIHTNAPYDQIVRNVVAASGDLRSNPGVVWYRSVNKTDQQVEDSAQLFLGMRLQCAKCHHHPFERWSQKDYYSYQAFFSRIGRKKNPDGLADAERVFHNRGKASAKNPRSGETLSPAGLGGKPLDLSPDSDPRQALVDWMVNPANPFFAKALVNRYWKHFFGRGLVDPEDDMRVTNPACNPELLEALAKSFIESKFDLKKLVRTICQSKVYQLSSIPNEHNVRDKQNFSRFYPRRLNAEVLYDALNQVTKSTGGFGGVPPDTRAIQLPDAGQKNYFLTVFGKPMADSACECERSNDANLAQSLHLLNSKEVLGKISNEKGRAGLLSRDDKRTEQEKLRELYLWFYSREPQSEEVNLALAHLGKGEKKAAYEDIIWALLNTKEFLFNH